VLGAVLALALGLAAPFGPREVVVGAVALLGNAADEHDHRVSVRTEGSCADVVIEHAAETPHDAAREGGARHEHRELCLSRSADALLSKLRVPGADLGGSWRLPIGWLCQPAPATAPASEASAAGAPSDARALRTVVLLV
jgi:hypothetical protein